MHLNELKRQRAEVDRQIAKATRLQSSVDKYLPLIEQDTEEGFTAREILEAIARRLSIPVAGEQEAWIQEGMQAIDAMLADIKPLDLPEGDAYGLNENSRNKLT